MAIDIQARGMAANANKKIDEAIIEAGAVTSVNGKAGAVVLSAKDVGAVTPEQLNAKQDVLSNGYEDLSNKPSVDGVVLSGNLTHEDLNVVGKEEFVETQELIGTEETLDPRLTATNIIQAINEHEQDLVDVNKKIDEAVLEAGAVSSVNGKAGEVVLSAKDVGAASVEQLAAKQDVLSNGYNDLTNKPSIGGVVLSGDLTHEDLNLVERSELTGIQDFVGIEETLDPRLTATNIAQAINEHEQDIVDVNKKIDDAILAAGAVTSVNGEVGEVVLSAEDVGAATVEQLNTKQDILSNGYEDLTNRPSIDGITLSGNLTHEELNLAGKAELTETQEFIGTEEVLDPRLTATNIVQAINEHEQDLVGLQAEQNHIFVDNEEQVSQYFMTDLNQFLFQDNTWELNTNKYYEVPDPKQVYVKLDFSDVHPLGTVVTSNNHVFGTYRGDYTSALRLHCTVSDEEDKIKVTMMVGSQATPVDITPTDVVTIVSGTGYQKLFVNGELVKELPNSTPAERLVVGDSENRTAFVEGSSISYKVYVGEFTENEEKAFVAEPIDIIEDIVVIDALGNTKKYFLPKADTSSFATKEDLAAKADKIEGAFKVYATGDAGHQVELQYSTDEVGGTLVQRTVGGHIEVSDPVLEADASNKKYVDAQAALKLNASQIFRGTQSQYYADENKNKYLIALIIEEGL